MPKSRANYKTWGRWPRGRTPHGHRSAQQQPPWRRSGKLPVMVLTHTMALAVEDIAALAISCKCGVSVTIPVAGTNALDNEKRCVSCGETHAFPDVGKVRRS